MHFRTLSEEVLLPGGLALPAEQQQEQQEQPQPPPQRQEPEQQPQQQRLYATDASFCAVASGAASPATNPQQQAAQEEQPAQDRRPLAPEGEEQESDDVTYGRRWSEDYKAQLRQRMRKEPTQVGPQETGDQRCSRSALQRDGLVRIREG